MSASRPQRRRATRSALPIAERRLFRAMVAATVAGVTIILVCVLS